MEDRKQRLDYEKEDERSWRRELQDIIGVLIAQIYMYTYMYRHVAACCVTLTYMYAS